MSVITRTELSSCLSWLAALATGIASLLCVTSSNRVHAVGLEIPALEQNTGVVRTTSGSFGQILVKFRLGVSPEEQEAMLQRYQLQLGRQSSSPYLSAAEIQSSSAATAWLDALNAEVLVDYAEPDYIYHALDPRYAAGVQPNDPYFPEQWGLNQIRAPEAWSSTVGTERVVIAVVDTGVDLTHPDLADNLVTGASFIGNSPSATDDSGHGTHIASTAAGVSNNHIGVAGVGWTTQIMPIKVLDAQGSGRVSDIADGIRWAVDHGADIVNLSLGGSVSTRTLKSAIDYADRKGVLVVAAVGNNYGGDNAVSYPAAYDKVLAVAASDRNDRHASFSSSGDYVDIAAPGVDILAATWRGSGYSYATYHGTSMATAFVSGVTALLLALDPDLTTSQLTSILQQTAIDLETAGWDPLTGYGRVDAAASVAFVVPASAEPSEPTPITQSYKLYLPALMH